MNDTAAFLDDLKALLAKHGLENHLCIAVDSQGAGACSVWGDLVAVGSGLVNASRRYAGVCDVMEYAAQIGRLALESQGENIPFISDYMRCELF